MYSNGPPHMAELKQDDQLEHTYSSCVRIRDVAQKTCQRRWTIGKSGKRGSGISVLAARHHDDDIYTFLHTPPLSVKFIFLWALIIGLNTLHSSYLPRTFCFFTTITYKSYNVNTNQIKNNDHIHLLLIPPKHSIYFLNLIIITLCSSVIIIIARKILSLWPLHYFHYVRTITDNNSIHNIYATFHQFIIIFLPKSLPYI